MSDNKKCKSKQNGLEKRGFRISVLVNISHKARGCSVLDLRSRNTAVNKQRSNIRSNHRTCGVRYPRLSVSLHDGLFVCICLLPPVAGGNTISAFARLPPFENLTALIIFSVPVTSIPWLSDVRRVHDILDLDLRGWLPESGSFTWQRQERNELKSQQWGAAIPLAFRSEC